MKKYNFFDEGGNLIEKRKCSQKEAEVFSKNFNLRFEEHKRKAKKNG